MLYVSLQMSRKAGFEGNSLYGFIKKGCFRLEKLVSWLEFLHRRFPEGVIVPDAVWQEVVETGHGRTGAEQVATAEWIL